VALSQPDQAVLRQAQRGDERAFAIIMRQYEIPVFNYVLRMVRNHHLAEEMTQEIFLRVFQGLARFSSQSRFTTWLFSVAKNRVLDELRALERRPRPIELEKAPPLRGVEVPFEQHETIDALWCEIGRLDVDLKMALLLRDVVGLSYQEIADSLEITLATVKWRIYKAREQIELALASAGLAPRPGDSSVEAAIAS
jgi:RNA polymerase sigma-70 factor (ECF subfamily)